MLCKFSNNPKYLEDLQNGFMYMNTSEYFNNLPKGVGDELDGKLVVNNFDISIKDKNSNNNIIQLSNNGNNHSYLEISFNKYFPIFCMARFKKNGFDKIIKERHHTRYFSDE